MREDKRREWEPSEDPVVQGGLEVFCGLLQLMQGWYLFTIYAALIGIPLLVAWLYVQEAIECHPEVVLWLLGVAGIGVALVVVGVLGLKLWAIWARRYRRQEGTFWSARDRNGNWYGGQG